MASAVRLVPLNYHWKTRNAFVDIRTRSPSLRRVLWSEMSAPESGRFRVNLNKVGRILVKCFSDAAIDTTMMWF